MTVTNSQEINKNNLVIRNGHKNSNNLLVGTFVFYLLLGKKEDEEREREREMDCLCIVV
jgi:hypothetical protein